MTANDSRRIVLVVVIFMLCFGTYATEHAYDIATNLKQEQLNLVQRQQQWATLQEQLHHEIGRFGGSAGIIVKDLETSSKILLLYINNLFFTAGEDFM